MSGARVKDEKERVCVREMSAKGMIQGTMFLSLSLSLTDSPYRLSCTQPSHFLVFHPKGGVAEH